jgi:urocanate hydratase
MQITNIPTKAYPFVKGIRRAPKRWSSLSKSDIELALKNALRYIPSEYHSELAVEFLNELKEHGRIYGYRFRPNGRIYAKSIDEYEGNCIEGKAFQLMMDNNLDFEVALYPYELVTYGETGQVCQNWMQYTLIKEYLKKLTNEQTLVIESGHPLGLFHSPTNAPRVIITNGLMVGVKDNLEDFKRFAALGVANYGQMTAGGLMYIGPQGIVHGTYSTLLNAARKLNHQNIDMSGLLFVSSGLGGMSGAQGKAAKIAKGVAIIAEVDYSRIKTRYDQGWVDEVFESLPDAFYKAKKCQENKTPYAIAYHGNVVDVLQYAIDNNIKIDLLSDQTSCHEVYDGGYCPYQIDFKTRCELLNTDKVKFNALVNEALKKHFELVKELTNRGTYFFDYGNSFMKAIFDSGIKEIAKNKKDDQDGFIFPSYVEDILGPQLFDYGYGPFRWVCLSGKDSDLEITDKAALSVIDPNRRYQDYDNYEWLKNAKANNLVVGSKARILYQDAFGRLKIALKFNELIREKVLGPVMLGRDHHDVSGTDSPYRETSNIKDGSQFMADMAIQCFAGNAARGMSMIALHNGGGVGIGKAINGGFGLVLDGSYRVDKILENAMLWDVMGGVARRSWARNPASIETVKEYNKIMEGKDEITLPYLADNELIKGIVEESYGKNN